METIYEMKLDVTIINPKSKSGELPMNATDILDLADKLKTVLDADDVHVTELKSFERDET